jgi:acyl dehydratase
MTKRPVGLYFEEYTVGEQVTTAERTITEADLVLFAALTGDYNPLHTSEEFAKTTQHGTRIAHGALTFSYAVGLMNQLKRGEGTVIAYAGIELKYVGVVKPGDTIHCVATVAEKRESKKPDRGVVIQKIQVLNQRGEVVIEQTGTLIVRKKPSEA